jgi:hypothetical protein
MKPTNCAALTIVALCSIHAHALSQELSFGAQLRPRYEDRQPISVTGSEFDFWVSMRARVHLAAQLEKNVSVFIQVQDVRMWGEESNTLGDFSADNFDLHQGYVEVHSNGATRFAARAGRQEVAFGGQRLVGAVNWAQQGRSFDALKLSATGDVFGLNLLAAVLANDLTATHDNDQYFLAAYGQLLKAGAGTLDFYGLYNRVDDLLNTDQVTLGTRFWGTKNSVSFRLEGSYQTGERQAREVSAFMLGARLGTALAGGKASLMLWYDFLSGDDDTMDEEVKVFDTLFATNHKFYGQADYFLNP